MRTRMRGSGHVSLYTHTQKHTVHIIQLSIFRIMYSRAHRTIAAFALLLLLPFLFPISVCVCGCVVDEHYCFFRFVRVFSATRPALEHKLCVCVRSVCSHLSFGWMWHRVYYISYHIYICWLTVCLVRCVCTKGIRVPTVSCVVCVGREYGIYGL